MKFYIFLSLLLCSTAVTFAQEPAICGEWTGTYTLSLPGNTCTMKRVIRINKYRDSFSIRMKVINLDKNLTFYENCIVTSSNENQINFYVDYPKEYEEDGTSSDGKHFFTANLVDCVLELTEQGNTTTLYDKRGNIDRVINVGPDSRYNMNLYKDGSDW